MASETVMRGSFSAAEMAKKEMGAMQTKSVKMRMAMRWATRVSAWAGADEGLRTVR